MSADETESITLLRNRLARISELIDDFENSWMNVSNSNTSIIISIVQTYPYLKNCGYSERNLILIFYQSLIRELADFCTS